MNDTSLFFSRQAALQELDLDRLRASSVIVVGLGNVGGPAALELARAGVGRLVLLDRDEVAPENASRGIFCACDGGLPKAMAAAARIAELVPGVEITPLIADARTEVPDKLFSAHNALLIATDSWSSRMHANRWAHALPGRTRIVVTGGLAGLSWEVTSSVPGSSLGCSQCPHGADVARRDEEGGCGVQVRDGRRSIDPSVSFTGAAVAATMVMEVCAALGGDGPRFAGRVVSFEYATGLYAVMQLAPDENCSGHMRLVEGRDFVTVPHCSTPRSLAACVERRMGWDRRDITLTAERDIVRSRTCRVCGRREPIFRALVNYGASAACACGARDFDYDVGTEVLDMDGTFAAQGIPDGKALVAHYQNHSIIVIRKELRDGLAQE
jgi:adenylyltransferase/sulfurtransferase